MTKAIVFLAPGFEEIEALSIVDILRRCQIQVVITGLNSEVVEGSHHVRVIPDRHIDEVDVKDFDAVVCPGGAPGFINLRKDSRVITIIQEAYKQNKVVAAICAAPTVLSDAGILKGKNCTIYPGMEDELVKGGGTPIKDDLVVMDGNIITSRGPSTAIVFSLKLAKMLTDNRIVEKVAKETLADIGVKFH